MASATRAKSQKAGPDNQDISAYFKDGGTTARGAKEGESGFSRDSLKALLKECLQDLEQKVESISDRVSTIMTEQRKLSKRMEDVETQYTELDKAMQFADNDIGKLKEENIELKAEVQKLQIKLDEFNKRTEQVESSAISLERYSRNYNLRFGGIPEVEDENCIEIIKKLAAEKFKMADILIDNAHRSPNLKVGHSKPAKPRHIIVKFPLRVQRSVLLRNWRTALRGTDIFVKPDLCHTDYKVKQSLRSVMDKAYNDKKKVKFVNGHLFINNSKYTPSSQEYQRITEMLHAMEIEPDREVIWGGDHNMTINPNLDRKGGNPTTWKKSAAILNELCAKFDLSDIWRVRFFNEMLEFWSEINPCNNFGISQQIIWNNKEIRINNQSVFDKFFFHKAHRNLPPTRTHRLMTIEEYETTQKSSPETVQEVEYCSIHINNKIDLYRETCQLPVCTNCTIDTHRKPVHVHRDLKDAADEYLTELKVMVDKLKVKEQEAEKKKFLAKQRHSVLRELCSRDERKVRMKAEEITKIKREEQRLIDELKNNYKLVIRAAADINDLELKYGRDGKPCKTNLNGNSTHLPLTIRDSKSTQGTPKQTVKAKDALQHLSKQGFTTKTELTTGMLTLIRLESTSEDTNGFNFAAASQDAKHSPKDSGNSTLYDSDTAGAEIEKVSPSDIKSQSSTANVDHRKSQGSASCNNFLSESRIGNCASTEINSSVFIQCTTPAATPSTTKTAEKLSGGPIPATMFGMPGTSVFGSTSTFGNLNSRTSLDSMSTAPPVSASCTAFGSVTPAFGSDLAVTITPKSFTASGSVSGRKIMKRARRLKT
ncbi:myosin-1-like [Ptychodera flava]|uniref:myosin-1-like n=1 Tax=Ptychodera flava TaxID=63121 RepID=UPI00396A0F1C